VENTPVTGKASLVYGEKKAIDTKRLLFAMILIGGVLAFPSYYHYSGSIEGSMGQVKI